MAHMTRKKLNIVDKHEKIVQCLKRGYSIKDTCRIVGIERQTLYNWLKEAEEDDATDEHIAFFCDFHDARGVGLEQLIKELDKWENETETVVVEKVNKKGEVVQRTTTKKKKRSRPSHFERAKFKLQSQYPESWGSRSVPEDEPGGEDNDKSATDLFEEWRDGDSDPE